MSDPLDLTALARRWTLKQLAIRIINKCIEADGDWRKAQTSVEELLKLYDEAHDLIGDRK